MKHILFTSLVCCFYFFSCASREREDEIIVNYRLDDFPVEKNLDGKKFEFDSILNPRKILRKGDYLIISEKGFDQLIHVLDKNRMTYLYSTGRQGDGPGEISSGVWFFDSGIYPDSFWAYDLSGKSFYQFAIPDTIPIAKRTIRQNESWFLGYSIHQIDENRFISYVSRDHYKFGIFDSLGNRISSIRPWSFTDSIDEMKGYILMGLNQGSIQYNPEKKILVHAGIKYEFIEIIKMETGEVIRLLGPSGVDLSYEIKGKASDPIVQIDSEIPRGFRDLYVGNNSIYLVYIGKTLKESHEEEDLPSTIFEFSLDGEPKSIYHCDFPIRAISVDESMRRIYAVTGGRDPGIAFFDY
jgi:hypothetical protein